MHLFQGNQNETYQSCQYLCYSAHNFGDRYSSYVKTTLIVTDIDKINLNFKTTNFAQAPFQGRDYSLLLY